MFTPCSHPPASAYSSSPTRFEGFGLLAVLAQLGDLATAQPEDVDLTEFEPHLAGPSATKRPNRDDDEITRVDELFRLQSKLHPHGIDFGEPRLHRGNTAMHRGVGVVVPVPPDAVGFDRA